ncbi:MULTISPECIES: hypothetical protein [Caproicibacterium]|jgi:hypothetical protein|uniref:Uncharacterized protein n=1 Tax=Caproicibacterium lactatifermentans TaxID=2666138 RepID=A0A859DSK5_9FIRM|nr:hypothetical protein [Caproicibacterium lactatifermentans]ARP51176.1 hypothetical protein B6259_09985 [Ruminococcaceae bacterium CPB6]MDD4806983.1 hypothetical protein [Oscillospiraceae bacterium]QKN24676.1 hypothetical protein GJQ69_09430 [Caproicibacterium lactatifermentans]QKO30175.1 hypothetical protein GKP14_03585 [Caproicibacterium lactatifermentans]
MEDLAQKLSAMLNDPSTMQQMQSIMGALGGGGAANAPPSKPKPTPTAPPPAGIGGLNTETLGLVTKLAPMFSAMQQEDNSTRLLHALRPLLGTSRQKKLDEALRLMQLMRALPMLKQAGLLGSL